TAVLLNHVGAPAVPTCMLILEPGVKVTLVICVALPPVPPAPPAPPEPPRPPVPPLPPIVPGLPVPPPPPFPPATPLAPAPIATMELLLLFQSEGTVQVVPAVTSICLAGDVYAARFTAPKKLLP